MPLSRQAKPRLSLNRITQVFFTLKEITKLAFKIKPKLLIISFIINILAGLSTLPGLYLTKLILDKLVSLIGTNSLRAGIISVGLLVSYALLFELIRSFLANYSSFLSRALARYFDSELSIMMGRKLSEIDITTIEDPEFRDKFTKIQNEAGSRAWDMIMPLSSIPNNLVSFLSTTLILFVLHPLISVGLIILAVPQIFINSYFIKKEYDLTTELSPLSKVWGWLESYLIRNRNFLELKLLNLTDFLASRQRTIVEEILQKRTKMQSNREMSRLWTYIPFTVFQLIISLYLIWLVIITKITIGSFQLYIQALRTAQNSLSALVSSLLEVYENYIYVADLVWFLHLDSEIETKANEGRITNNTPEIKFEDVWFRYREDGEWILKDINFNIKPGEKIAIVGENGAGKSTLIKLLARFYDPVKGHILIDDIDLKKIDLLNWRKSIGILFQMFELYPFSAKEAIGYGDVKRLNEIDEIRDAAKKTGVHEFIESLPEKYNNPLSPEFDKGVMPSIGQWQRIGISRMLFRKDANILILDEPTSSVDPKAEENIFNELAKIAKNKILIFVTQRFSTVRIADRIFVMSNGKIVEQGTHEELMKQKGKYEELYILQAKAFEDNSKIKS